MVGSVTAAAAYARFVVQHISLHYVSLGQAILTRSHSALRPPKRLISCTLMMCLNNDLVGNTTLVSNLELVVSPLVCT